MDKIKRTTAKSIIKKKHPFLKALTLTLLCLIMLLIGYFAATVADELIRQF